MKKKTLLTLVLTVILSLTAAFLLSGCDKTCTVKFDTHGGSEIAPITVNAGDTFVLPQNPKKFGMEFSGWYLDEQLVQEFIETQKINEDITLYAKWTEKAAISFDFEFSTFLKNKTTGDNNIIKNVNFGFSAFSVPSDDENGDIAKFAYKTVWATGRDASDSYSEGYKKLESFFTQAGFVGLYFNDDYKVKPTADTMAFGVGYRDIGEVKVVVVALRSLNYDGEWISNVNMGTENEHEGFYTSAQKVYGELKEYIATTFSETDEIKLLVTGYSRGGAVAEQLGRIMDDDVEFNRVTKSNLYVYAFNPPLNSKMPNDTEKYSNVHAFYSSCDVVYHILRPWDFGYIGTVKDISTEKLYDYINDNFDTEIPEFSEATLDYSTFSIIKKEDGDIKTFKEFYDKLITVLVFESENEEYLLVDTREKYMQNLYPVLEYLIGLMFDDNYDYVWALQNFDMSKVNFMFIMELLDKDSGKLYEEVTFLFDSAGFPYDATALKSACDTIQWFAYTYMSNDLSAFITVGATGYYHRRMIIVNHDMEGVDFLLNEYCSK
ncbi:MAG: InlB B-repeat-containing protein [Clostridia bacterium]|nr:InlB B-repeat-containing protein [Clostridia bacterium]